MPEPAEYLNWLNRVIQGGERGIPITEMGKSIGRAAGRLLGPGMVGGAQLPGLRTMAPWLLRLGMAHPLGAIAAAASIPTYGRFRKQIDPLWGLNDPWGMGDPSERGIAQLDPYAAGILEKAKIKPAGAPTVTPQTPQQSMQTYLADLAAANKVSSLLEEGEIVRFEPMDGYDIPIYRMPDGTERRGEPLPARERPGAMAPGLFRTYAEAQAEADRIGKGMTPKQLASGYWTLQPPETISLEAQKRMDIEERKLVQDKETEEKRLAQQWKIETGRMEAQRQVQLAQLRANPASWLEYASLAGTTPGVQPWMMPLMPPGYTGVPMGGPLPGWPMQAWGGTEGGGALTLEQEWDRQRRLLLQSQTASMGTAPNLPKLTQPSRQYQARMGPTAMAEYGGYERMRTGITPEELQFRLWSQAPPGGQIGGLNWMR